MMHKAWWSIEEVAVFFITSNVWFKLKYIYSYQMIKWKYMNANFTLLQNFADSCLKNDLFFSISRIGASHWKNTPFSRKWVRAWYMYMLWSGGAWGGVVFHDDISMASCQRGPTRYAYAWQIGPFWQDTLDTSPQTDPMSREASMKEEPDCSTVNTMPGGDHIQTEASENEHDSDGQKALSSTTYGQHALAEDLGTASPDPCEWDALADLILEVEGRTIYTSQYLLGKLSPVFRKMISEDKSNKNPKVFPLAGKSSDAIGQLASWLLVNESVTISGEAKTWKHLRFPQFLVTRLAQVVETLPCERQRSFYRTYNSLRPSDAYMRR